MSSLTNLWGKGLLSMVTGPVAVVVGLVTGVKLLALAGLIILVWGGYRFYAARRTGR